MRVLFWVSVILWILWGCNHRDEENCYPREPVAKTVILVADTTILSRTFIPENDTIKTYPIFNGIGFVKRDGTPVHKPLQVLVLSEKQQKDFLRILRPIPQLNQRTTTDCIPYFRHVVLFYDKTNHLIGQIHICFDCDQVRFLPAPDCLNYFSNVRLKEIETFFKKNKIPMMDDR